MTQAAICWIFNKIILNPLPESKGFLFSKEKVKVVFSDLQFITIYMPIFFTVYLLSYKLEGKHSIISNTILVLASIIFYVLDAGWYTLALLALFLITWLIGGWIDNYRRKRTASNMQRFLLVILCCINGLFLVSYKLLFNSMLIGVGFFTLQMISYGVDIYRGKIKAEKNIIKALSYAFMFTKVLEGPIARYGKIEKHLNNKKINLTYFDRGIKLFVYGLALKVLLADRIGLLWRELSVIGYESISTGLAWLGIVGYSLMLYFDFAGYTMMAAGLGQMLGIPLPQNFNEPYMAKTVSDFYRRWHMSLGLWFRDYIYIPLGGNKKGPAIAVFNVMLVWLTTALWHGFSIHYLCWAGFLSLFIIIEKLFIGRFLSSTKVIGHIYIWLLIPVSWVFFGINNIHQIFIFLGRMFPFGSQGINVDTTDFLRYGMDYAIYLIPAILLCIPAISRFFLKIRKYWWSGIITVILFAICVYCIAINGGNTFMYLNY